MRMSLFLRSFCNAGESTERARVGSGRFVTEIPCMRSWRSDPSEFIGENVPGKTIWASSRQLERCGGPKDRALQRHRTGNASTIAKTIRHEE